MKKNRSYAFFSEILLDWDRHDNFRTMPWKCEKDPYKIWLSEVILQQTRVEQGLSYYLHFVDQFPDVHHLAKAEETLIFKMWEGLGYYSRCRNLIHTARYVSENLNGQFPQNYEGLIQLKGIGPYTASAIASFAFGELRAVVDGNVIRVLSRIFGLEIPWDTPEGKKKFEDLAQQLIDPTEPGRYNQAIMDFGATICKPRNPDCVTCPFNQKCQAHLHEKVDLLPVKSKRIKVRERWFNYFICHYNNGIYISQRDQKDIWQGLHEFVCIETDQLFTPQKMLGSKQLKMMLTMPYKVVHKSEVFTQKLTHQTIHARFFELSLEQPYQNERFQWIGLKNLRQHAFPRLINSYLEHRPLTSGF